MLRLIEIDKTYGATRAVKSVSLQAEAGEVLGLVGENGAGKSTLIKIVSGAILPDRGSLELDGKGIRFRHTTDAIAQGISSVFQELTLIRELTVERNLFLTNAPQTIWWSIDRKKMRRQASEILQRYNLDIDPSARIRDLPLGQQQMVEIVRAVERRPRVLLLDEATSALGAAEVEWLANLVTELRRKQMIILFISHRWDEVIHFCDRVAILRNGDLVTVTDTDALSEGEAVRLMTGQSNDDSSFPVKAPANDSVKLTIRDLHSKVLRGVGLDLHTGEILGLGGLVGQGQGALLESIFGAHPLDSGTISIDGTVQSELTPSRAIAAGIAYIPQERKIEGLLLSKSVATNVTLAMLQQLQSIFGVIRPGTEKDMTDLVIARAQIRTLGPSEPVGNLSGGNQQKVLLEKWLMTKPTILLLNDVTRGVDQRTKHHIYDVVAGIARQGTSVIWYSTDARELVGLAHRVLVLLHGGVNAVLSGADIAVDRIVHASVMDTGREASDVRIAG